MVKLLKDIKNSVFGPEYYKEVLSKPISYSLKYYALFSLLVALVAAVVLSLSFIPDIKSFINYAQTKIVSEYPQGLEVNIKNGQASANVQQPYFVKMPRFSEGWENKTKAENLIVIDTENSFDLEKFNLYKTFAVLNKDTLSYEKDGGVSVQSLKDAPNLSINKEQIILNVEKIKPFIKFIYPISIVLAFLITLLILAWNLIYLFLAALLIWLIAKIKKTRIGYLKSYQAGIHLMTPVIILTLILNLLEINVPYIFTTLLVLAAVINLKKDNLST